MSNIKKDLYFLDTITSAIKNNDNDTYNIDNNYINHFFNVYFPFKVAIKNIKSISLKSVQIPLLLYNIRAGLTNTNTFSFRFTYSTFNNITLTFTLTPNNYTSTTLITAINNAIVTILTPYTGTSIVLSIVNNFCTIIHNCTSLFVIKLLLSSSILGFINYSTVINSTPLVANIPINVNIIDSHIYMLISNIPITNNNFIGVNNKNFTFKISLDSIVNNIAYLNDANELQTIYFNKNDSFTLDKLNVIFYDKFGYSIIGYYDWAATLIIEYDNETQQQQFINFEY